MYTGSEAIIGRGTQFGIGPVSGTAAPTGITATTTSGSAGLTAVSSTTGVVVGMSVTGTGIPAGTTVTSKGSGVLGLSANATASGTLVALTFGIGYITVGECNDSSPSGRQWDVEEATNFQSNVDKEYIKGLRNPGKFTVKYNNVDSDAGQEALETAFGSTSPFLFQLQFPPQGTETVGEAWTFSALVLSVDPPEIVPGKVITGACELQVTGPRTVTPGS
jgi:Lambda phage tail tube protein, TTP